MVNFNINNFLLDKIVRENALTETKKYLLSKNENVKELYSQIWTSLFYCKN